eukprot:CFRG7901T1
MTRSFTVVLALALLIDATVTATSVRLNKNTEGDHAAGTKEADQIIDIPGYGIPPTKMYSGYLRANGHDDESEYGEEREDFLHYWLVESENDPATDPLIIWLNGGPGASSLMGFFTELGPLVLDKQDGVMRNSYSWAQAGNLLFFESPSGVGFSYCEDKVDGTNKKCSNGDTSTAAQNLEALRTFVKRYPEYQGRDLIITGESYAGVYVPTFALNVVNDDFLDLNLVSLMVGNPCTDDASQDSYLGWNLRYAFENGLLDENLYHQLTVECGMSPNDSNSKPVSNLPKCTAAYRLYLIASSDNTGPAASLPGSGFVDGYATFGAKNQPFWDEAGRWLNKPEVQKALHVDKMGITWSLFANRLDYHKEYNACNDSNNKLSDPSVQMHGTSNAVRAIGEPVKENHGWRPWFYQTDATTEDVMKQKSPYWGTDLSLSENGVQLGGYVVDYEQGLSFVTFHSAGHMVPQYKAVAALHFVLKVSKSKLLSPPLPSWNDMETDDNAFYGDGIMAEWVKKAQASDYLD